MTIRRRRRRTEGKGGEAECITHACEEVVVGEHVLQISRRAYSRRARAAGGDPRHAPRALHAPYFSVLDPSNTPSVCTQAHTRMRTQACACAGKRRKGACEGDARTSRKKSGHACTGRRSNTNSPSVSRSSRLYKLRDGYASTQPVQHRRRQRSQNERATARFFHAPSPRRPS